MPRNPDPEKDLQLLNNPYRRVTQPTTAGIMHMIMMISTTDLNQCCDPVTGRGRFQTGRGLTFSTLNGKIHSN